MLKVKIYGERNTNTNYLEKLLITNFTLESLAGSVPPYIYNMQSIIPGNELLRDLYFRFTHNVNGGWKHSFPILPTSNTEDFLPITLTKNPYAWLLSLYVKPYHQPKYKNDSFEEFLQCEWHTIRRENLPSKTIVNPIVLWNLKNFAYLKLANSCRVINLTAEELIEHPSRIFDQLSTEYGLDYKNGTFLNYDEAAKPDNDKDNNYYQNYYINELWRSKLNKHSVELINQHIDPLLMDKFGYKVLNPLDF
jgi:hypothetical protein